MKKNKIVLILTLVFSLSSNLANAQMSKLKFNDTTKVLVTGTYVAGQNIDTFRDSIGSALSEKYGYTLYAEKSLKGGCDRKAEEHSRGKKLEHGVYGEEGIFYSTNMTSHDPITTYPPSYVADRFIGRMEDTSAPYYETLQLGLPTKYWAELYFIGDQYYLVITVA